MCICKADKPFHGKTHVRPCVASPSWGQSQHGCPGLQGWLEQAEALGSAKSPAGSLPAGQAEAADDTDTAADMLVIHVSLAAALARPPGHGPVFARMRPAVEAAQPSQAAAESQEPPLACMRPASDAVHPPEAAARGVGDASCGSSVSGSASPAVATAGRMQDGGQPCDSTGMGGAQPLAEGEAAAGKDGDAALGAAEDALRWLDAVVRDVGALPGARQVLAYGILGARPSLPVLCHSPGSCVVMEYV